MAPVRASLWRDQRGGVEAVLYLMMIAGIALAALPGVRHFTRSDKKTFQGSTTRFDRPGTYVGGRIQHGGGSHGLDVSPYRLVSYNPDEQCTMSSIDQELDGGFEVWESQPGNSSGDGWVDRQIYFCHHTGLGMKTADGCTMAIAERNRNIERGRIASQRGCYSVWGEQQQHRRGLVGEAENRACYAVGVTAWTAMCIGTPGGFPKKVPGGGAVYPPKPGVPGSDKPDLCRQPSKYLTYDSTYDYCFWNR